jgi:hypothetical protein
MYNGLDPQLWSPIFQACIFVLSSRTKIRCMATVVHAGSMTDDFATVTSQLSEHSLTLWFSYDCLVMIVYGRWAAPFWRHEQTSMYHV